MLKYGGVYSHLASDHYHYWEDGGATYHPRYSSWEFFRGQEGDPHIGQFAEPATPGGALGRHANIGGSTRQDLINRQATKTEADLPQVQTFSASLEFIERNRDDDNWFLQIETFDSHEPFFSLPEHQQLYGLTEGEPIFDWPHYREVEETPEQIEKLRAAYSSLVSLCDKQLGRVLDAMDEHNLWEDTMLIVWTDHGFMLGERGWTGKLKMPWWEELARTPFFVHDPRHPAPGERRQALVQPSIDLGPTLLEYFGLEPTSDMLGHDLAPVIQSDEPVREAAIWGQFAAPVNVTDGLYVYMRAEVEGAPNPPMFTLTCTSLANRFTQNQMQDVTMHSGFGFTKGFPLMRIADGGKGWNANLEQSHLFDLESDPKQEQRLQHPEVEARMIEHLTRLMRECEAPPEQFERLGLS